MQISATRHSFGVSTRRTAGFRYSFSGSEVNRDASCPRVSGGAVGRESGKGAFTTGTSSAETPARTRAVSGESGSAVADLLTDMAAGVTVEMDGSGSATGISATDTQAGTTAGSGDAGSAAATSAMVIAITCGASMGV